jgi:hypothetical protein
MKTFITIISIFICTNVFSQNMLVSKCPTCPEKEPSVGTVVWIGNPDIISPIGQENVFRYQIVVQDTETSKYYTKILLNTEKVYQIMQFLHIDNTFIRIKSVEFVVSMASLNPLLIKE